MYKDKYQPYSLTTSIFTALKILCSPYSSLPLPSPRQPLTFYFLKFTFIPTSRGNQGNPCQPSPDLWALSVELGEAGRLPLSCPLHWLRTQLSLPILSPASETCCCCLLPCSFLFFFLLCCASCGNLSSPSRDRTQGSCSESRVLTMSLHPKTSPSAVV